MADKPILVPAGGTVVLRAVGDFIFCKFTDRPLVLNIQDREGTSDGPVEVKNGSMRRPPGGVSVVEITNNDPTNDCAAVFFVGKGDFDDKIIQGEVTVMPGVRGSDGVWRDDTRHELVFDMVPIRAAVKLFNSGTLIAATDGDIQDVTEALYSHLTFGGWSTRAGIGQSDTGPGWFLSETDGAYPVGGASLLVEFDADMNIAAHHVTPAGIDWPLAGTIRNGQSDVCAVGSFVVSGGGGGAYVQGITGSHWDKRLAFWNLDDNSYGELYDFGDEGRGRMYSVCPYNGAVLAITQSDGASGTDNDAMWHLIATDGTKLDEGVIPVGVNLDNRSLARYDAARDGIVMKIDAASLLTFNPDNGTYSTESLPDVMDSVWQGWAPAGRHLIRLNTVDKRVERVVFADFQSPMQIDVVTSCSQWGALVDRELETFHTRASVAVEAAPGGQIRVSGEVIRAALEFYFRRTVPDDYMDHVYSFETNGDPYGGAKIIAHGGGQSLKKIGAADNFDVVLPASFRVTVDQDLQRGLGSPGEV